MDGARLAGRIDHGLQRHLPPQYLGQRSTPSSSQTNWATPSMVKEQLQEERDSVFKRLGLSTDAEFASEQAKSRSLTSGISSGVPGYPPTFGAPTTAAPTVGAAPRMDDVLRKNTAHYASSQQSTTSSARSGSSSSTAGPRPGATPVTGLGNYANHSTSTRLSGGPMAACSSGTNRTNTNTYASSEESDVLKRLGLCSNEDYERQTRSELQDAVRSLRHMQERLGGGLM
ncbi:unnamed protein product [Amoebophrya sp. A25]|nr:unnamed protein product [Amoebophrya sp. A25]|eukprot:GSA25T00026606001.1